MHTSQTFLVNSFLAVELLPSLAKIQAGLDSPVSADARLNQISLQLEQLESRAQEVALQVLNGSEVVPESEPKEMPRNHDAEKNVRAGLAPAWIAPPDAETEQPPELEDAERAASFDQAQQNEPAEPDAKTAASPVPYGIFSARMQGAGNQGDDDVHIADTDIRSIPPNAVPELKAAMHDTETGADARSDTLDHSQGLENEVFGRSDAPSTAQPVRPTPQGSFDIGTLEAHGPQRDESAVEEPAVFGDDEHSGVNGDSTAQNTGERLIDSIDSLLRDATAAQERKELG